MDVPQATKIVTDSFTPYDVENAPDTLIGGVRGYVVSEAFIVYCKEWEENPLPTLRQY